VRVDVDRFFVKIDGITSEQDALMSIAFGASAVGFVFAPSVRQMTPAAVGDIVRRLPPESLTVGVFRNEQPERVVEIANSIGLSAVQLHGNESLMATAFVAERVRTVIRGISVHSDHLARLDAAQLDYLLLDGDEPGSGQSHEWGVLRQHSFVTPVIGAGGLDPESVVTLVRDFPVWGVDVSSGVESAPGIKDPALVADFVNNARWAFDQRDEGLDDRPFDWSRG
jgi:phosphoribosylanthranilate isomerase